MGSQNDEGSSGFRPRTNFVLLILTVVILVVGLEYQQVQINDRLAVLEEAVLQLRHLERMVLHSNDLHEENPQFYKDAMNEESFKNVERLVLRRRRLHNKNTRGENVFSTEDQTQDKGHYGKDGVTKSLASFLEPMRYKVHEGSDPPSHRTKRSLTKKRNKKKRSRRKKGRKGRRRNGGKKCCLPSSTDKSSYVATSHFIAELDPSLTKQQASGDVVVTHAGTVAHDTITPNTEKEPYRFWKASNTSDVDTFNFSYLSHNGAVTIKRTGVYLIYSQVLYHEQGPRHAYSIRANNLPLATCMTTVPPSTNGSTEEFHTCSLTLAAPLEAGVVMDVTPMHKALTVVVRPRFTYWGLVRLGSAS